MNVWARKNQGFTIVELLIVIVVIAILAAITIVAFNGIQARASDSRRVSDIKAIQKSIELYRVQYGEFPPVTTANKDGLGWEASYVNDSFLPVLKTSGVINSDVPLDPVNDSTYYYRYYRYDAGQNGCDTARGQYYVLQIRTFKGETGDAGPGFKCPGGRNWGDGSSAWTTGGYLN